MKNIPRRLRESFKGHMDAANDEDSPDGAWFARLEHAGHTFVRKHNLHWLDGNDAAHIYVASMATKEQG